MPKGKEEGASLALSIVRKAVSIEGKEIVEAFFPMKKGGPRRHGRELDARWGETVAAILGRLERGVDMAFITIGDPAFYSTFFYLYERLLEASPGLRIEIIPGVSSINASASRARISLGPRRRADRHPARGLPGRAWTPSSDSSTRWCS